MHDADHKLLTGVLIKGAWSSKKGLYSDTCTTGDGGGIGTCIVLYPGIRKKSVTEDRPRRFRAGRSMHSK